MAGREEEAIRIGLATHQTGTDDVISAASGEVPAAELRSPIVVM
jgi:hypothetical protein